MAERLISIQDTNQFQTLCGSFDENLKLLEQRYHVRMICRGEELRVQGDGAQVELAAGAVVFSTLSSILTLPLYALLLTMVLG